jgi:hypothetical protein
MSLLDQPQQVGVRNLTFQTEVIEQRFGAVVLPIMISRPPKMKIQQCMLTSKHAFAKSHLLIGVTFPTSLVPSVVARDLGFGF